MKSSPIAVKLDVYASDRSILADLSFQNGGASDFYLYKVNAFYDGRIRNDLFRITANGERVKYHGFLAKRRPPQPGDFICIAPGTSWDVQVNLSDTYAFPEGNFDYSIYYEALEDSSDGTGLLVLRSNTVRFAVE